MTMSLSVRFFLSFDFIAFKVNIFLIYKYNIAERVIVRIFSLRKWLSTKADICCIYLIIPKLIKDILIRAVTGQRARLLLTFVKHKAKPDQ